MQTANKRGIRACEHPNPPLSLLGLDTCLYRGDPFDMNDPDKQLDIAMYIDEYIKAENNP